MYKHSFDFGTAQLTITAKKVINTKILDELFRLVQLFKYDFNQNIHNSSAYTFNDTAVGVPCALTEEFIEFLQVNLMWLERTEGIFNPFSNIDNAQDLSVDKILDIDDLVVVKQEDLILNTKLLLEPFLVDLFFEILKQHGVRDFLLSTSTYNRTDDTSSWPVEFKIEDIEPFRTTIQDEAIALQFNTDFSDLKTDRIRFASVEKTYQFKFAIYKTKECVEQRALLEYIRKLETAIEFSNFCLENNIELTIIDTDDIRHDYPNK